MVVAFGLAVVEEVQGDESPCEYPISREVVAESPAREVEATLALAIIIEEVAAGLKNEQAVVEAVPLDSIGEL